MSDFFSQVAAAGNTSNNQPDDTTTFAEAIAARFGQGDNVLTARLLHIPNTPMTNLSIVPLASSEYTAVPPMSLGAWLDDPQTLVVDIRPHAAYSSARLARAVSLSVPSTLLKRPLFSLQRLSGMLPSHSARTRFAAWRQAPRILVYDADSAALSDTSNIQGLLRKFRAEAPDAATQLAWVQGGFQAVWSLRRDLVDVVPPTPETETETDDDDDPLEPASSRVLRAHHLPRSAFALTSTTQGPRTAGPMLLHPSAGILPPAPSSAHQRQEQQDQPTAAFNPFFDAVRQNAELSHGITERIPLRLPRRVRRRVSELPFQWLRDIARRAAPVTPPDALPPSTNIGGGYNPYALRSGGGRVDSSEDENESSDSSASASVGASSPYNASPLHHAPAHRNHTADIEEGSEALAMQFYRIELAEQRRMMGVMEHHSRESGPGEHAPAAASAPTSNSGSEEEGRGEKKKKKKSGSADSGTSTSTSDSTDVNSLSTASSSSGSASGDAAPGDGAALGGGNAHEREEGKQGGRGKFPFSITAGVEKGSKNRYRNIWPFEHARVRLHRLHAVVASAVGGHGHGHSASASATDESASRKDAAASSGAFAAPPHRASSSSSHTPARPAPRPRIPTDDDSASASASASSDSESSSHYDDYVNASYVQPLGTRRRYIATQGPLEATFGDFWTLVWQQNTHVIVMLTREVEGAMVKCGAYWRAGTYGPLRVELLGCAAEGCTGVCAVCEGAGVEGGVGAGAGGGGGFFNNNAAGGGGGAAPPTPPAPQLIKRTLRLTHAAHPRAPPRRVVQLQYLGWPDMNVPEDARGVLGLVWEVGRCVEEVADASAASAEVVVVAPTATRAGTGADAMDQDGDAREDDDTPPRRAERPRPDEVDSSEGSGSDSEVDATTGVLRRALRAGDAAAPVLLHCSAGVGRTGGFIAVDAVLDAVRWEAREMYAGAGAGAGARGSFGSGGSGSGSGSGAEGIGGISAWMRASGISGGGGFRPVAGEDVEANDRMDVDVQVEDADAAAEAEMHEGRGMRTPMQVDGAEVEMGLGNAAAGDSTRRWAEQVAYVKSGFAPGSLPTTATAPFPLSLPSTAPTTSTSGPLPSSLGAPFQLQAPAHRTTFSLTLPAAQRSLPTATSPSPSSAGASPRQSPENKAASLPLKGAAVPLSVRRGYADYRLRTFSAPTAAVPVPAQPSAGSSTWLLPPSHSQAQSPVPARVLADRPLANSPLPDRPRSISPFRAAAAAPPTHRSMHSVDSVPDDAALAAAAQQQRTKTQQQHMDYKAPRALHGRADAGPVRLSGFEDPIWEVVQDMREQRMSLCQSLRQYVFVHAAIIEGSLMVLDEERARAGVAWRMPAPGPMRRRGVGMTMRPARPALFLRPSDEERQSTTSSTGKRLASPTELPKEDKKGEIALSKRPSLKRKQASGDEYAPPLPTYPPP